MRCQTHIISVVPAKAGTHNHGPQLLRELVFMSSFAVTTACGYGSRICARLSGATRRSGSLVRDDSVSGFVRQKSVRHGFAFSRRHRVRALQDLRPSANRGRREGRVPAAPAAPVHKKSTGMEPQVKAETSGLPCAMVLRLIRALPGNRAFLLPSPARRSWSGLRAWPQRREARTTRFHRPQQSQSSCAKAPEMAASIASRAQRS
jgi:hypothetical protein